MTPTRIEHVTHDPVAAAWAHAAHLRRYGWVARVEGATVIYQRGRAVSVATTPTFYEPTGPEARVRFEVTP